MRLSTTPTNLTDQKDIASLLKYLSPWVKEVSDTLNGNVGFTDNIKLSTITVSFTASGTNVSTNHDLKATPSAYIVIGKSAPIDVYDGTSGNTASVINLRASGQGSVRLLIY